MAAQTQPTSLTIRDLDFTNALKSLQTTPAVELVRTLRIILTNANILY